jgi:hypothetical protein
MSTTNSVSIAADIAGQIPDWRSKFVSTLGSVEYQRAAG